ncbi:Nn.00g102520.m01.CDS01 [Neocucurbitaria sp. VM-36]
MVSNKTVGLTIYKHEIFRNSHEPAHKKEVQSQRESYVASSRVPKHKQGLSHKCSHCNDTKQVLIKEKTALNEEIITLQIKLRQLGGGMPDLNYKHLCVQTNAKIKSLRSYIEEVRKEDKKIKTKIKGAEITLRRLEEKITTLQPSPEFAVKEVKNGKKK